MNATRLPALVACALIVVLASPRQLPAQAVAGADIWRAFTQTLEPGKTLKVRLKGGQRFKATLLAVSADAMTVQPKTRAAVPPQRVSFDQIETLEVDQAKGLSIGKAIAVGAGVAAGAWLTLMVFAFAVLGD